MIPAVPDETAPRFRKDTTQTKQAKETEKRQKNERLGNAKVELAANRNELAEVVQYIADLRPSCDDIRTTSGFALLLPEVWFCKEIVF